MNLQIRMSMIARRVLASIPEKEVERLLGVVLRGSPFSGKAHAVGGFVRDELLGVVSKDLDIVVEMRGGAEKLTRYLNRKFPNETSRPYRLGAGYPIWQITFKEDIEVGGKVYKTSGAVIEVADTQKEMFPDPNSRSRVVEYGTLKDDIERRDFTVNMLLKDLTSGEIIDLTGTSLSDLKNGVLRGNPDVDFDKILKDDPLRMMRLIRFQAKYGWNVPMFVLRAVRSNASRIGIVSAERVKGELEKMMKIGKLAQGIRLMKTVGLLKYVLPEVQALSGVQQQDSRGMHREGDVLKHTLMVLRNAGPGVESQLAALLHDVGKPETQETIDGLIRFVGHEKVGGEIAEGIMRRLRFDSTVVKRVRTMVQNHMRPHGLSGAGPNALRRFVRDVGEELVDSVLNLAEADQLGNLPPTNSIPGLREKMEKLRENVKETEKPVLDGREVQRILNIRPGRLVGEVLTFLSDKAFEMSNRGRKLDKRTARDLILKEFGDK